MKIKVLHIIDHAYSGGAQQLLLDLIHGLKDQIDFTVVSLGRPGGHYMASYAQSGARTYAVKSGSSRWDPRAVFELAGIVRSEKPDILHTHLFKSNLLGGLIGRVYKVPTIIHDHTGLFPFVIREFFPPVIRDLYNVIIRWIIRGPSFVITLTKKMRENYFRCHQIQDDRILILPNFVDLNKFTQLDRGTNGVRNELGLDQDVRLVGMIARLKKEKDLNCFLDVAQYVEQNDHRKVCFLIVGEGVLRNDLENTVKEKRIGNVNFLGYRKDVPAILAELDVFVLTSKYEPFGIVLLEAMAAGCPIVSTKTDGAMEVLGESEVGFLVDIGDVAALGNQIIYLLDNPDIADLHSQKGRKLVMEHYKASRLLKKYHQVYAHVLREN